MQNLLSIAGFDPSSGAGVTQDLLTFRAYGYHPLAVPAVVVAENSWQVAAIQPLQTKLLRSMLKLLDADFNIAGIKLGLLGAHVANIKYLGQFLAKQRSTPAIWDPVLHASSGSVLTQKTGYRYLEKWILPEIDLFTPNALEFSHWMGQRRLLSTKVLEQTALKFTAQHRCHLLITGIEISDKQVGDLYCSQTSQHFFLAKRHTFDPHGSGCLYSCLLLIGMLRHPHDHQRAVAWAHRRMQAHWQHPLRPAKSLRPFLSVGLS